MKDPQEQLTHSEREALDTPCAHQRLVDIGRAFVVDGMLSEHEPCNPGCRGWDAFDLPMPEHIASKLGVPRADILRCDECCAGLPDYDDDAAVIDAARWAREVIRNERVGADLGAVLFCLANTEGGRAALYQAFDAVEPYTGPFYGPPTQAVSS